MEVLMAIHERGLDHNNFCPENVVIDDFDNPSSVRVIDFKHSSPHKCERQTDIAAYAFPPNRSRFGCQELYKAATESCVWTPRTCCKQFSLFDNTDAFL